MPKYTTEDIRNLVLVGAKGAGKTTLIEQMLANAGVIGRPGRVEDHNTVCDYTDLEKVADHSLESAVVHFDHNGAHINLIDTPGASDFLGAAISTFPGVETVLVMIDANSGITTVTRRLVRLAKARRLPCLIVVNKIDAEGDLPGLLGAIEESFGSECKCINLPTGGGTGVVDCFQNAEGDSDLGSVGDFHTAIIDQVVEIDEALMTQYLESGEVTPAQLHDPFERALREAHLIPICFASGRENVGVTELTDIIQKLCPNPKEGNPRPFVAIAEDGSKEDVTVEADPDKPLIAHTFKISSDPFVGKLAVFRVHQGTLTAGETPIIDDGKKGVRMAHIFKLQGKNHAECESLIPGDIGAVAKVDELHYNSVIHSSEHGGSLRLDPVPLPKPMYGLAIEGTSKGAETKIGDALRKMDEEDPTFTTERVATTGELVIRGLGDLHLRFKLRLLKDVYGVEVDTSPPKVAYKETITSKAEGHHRHKKQSGGAGQFGEVYLRVEPLNGEEEGVVDGLLFVDDTFGGSVPKQFMPAIEKGIRRVMQEGAIAGYPMQDIKVAVYDGKHHPVDSKEVAFMTAGRRAFIDAVQKARPVLLEPIVHMDITVPADMIGDISSDISGRRGRIQGTEMLPGNQAIVTVEAPLSEVMTYASQLKSITGGAGSYTMEYSHDEATPPNVQQQVVAEFKPQEDED